MTKAEQPTIAQEPWIQEFIDVYIAPNDATHVAEFLQSKCSPTSLAAQDGLVEASKALLDSAGSIDHEIITVGGAQFERFRRALSAIKGDKS